MDGEQSKGAVLNLKETKVDDLKRIIARQYREILVKNERLKGVEDLTRICSELEEKRQKDFDAVTKENIKLKGALEHIVPTELGGKDVVVKLQLRVRNGLETAFDIDVVNPGVSRKDFDAVPKGNIKLKESLEHTVPTELDDKDVVVMSNEEREELVKVISEQEAKIQEANKSKAKAESELSETRKKCAADLQKKQQESEKEISSLTRTNEILRAKDAENRAMMTMQRDALKMYEDDFRRENEEKAAIQKRLNEKQQASEREIERVLESNSRYPMRLPIEEQGDSG